MGDATIKQMLINERVRLLHEHGLVHFDEVILRIFDDVSQSPDRRKVYKLAKDVWLRLSRGTVNIESLKYSTYIENEKAIQYHKRLGMPLYEVGDTGIYQTELEALAMEKKIVIVPDKVDVVGAVAHYNTSPLQSCIAEVLAKFAVDNQATEPEITRFLTTPYPNGGGWYKHTTSFAEQLHPLLVKMANKGQLIYDDRTEKYQLIHKPSTTRLR